LFQSYGIFGRDSIVGACQIVWSTRQILCLGIHVLRVMKCHFTSITNKYDPYFSPIPLYTRFSENAMFYMRKDGTVRVRQKAVNGGGLSLLLSVRQSVRIYWRFVWSGNRVHFARLQIADIDGLALSRVVKQRLCRVLA
jgi:hypothetical protein